MGLFNWKKKEEFVSPMTGILHPIEEVPDPVFSDKIMGDGFAVEVLIHIGIETVKLEGQGFQVMVKAGDTVKQGDVLVKVDVDYVKSQDKSLYSPVIFTGGQSIKLMKTGNVNAGDGGIIQIQ